MQRCTQHSLRFTSVFPPLNWPRRRRFSSRTGSLMRTGSFQIGTPASSFLTVRQSVLAAPDKGSNSLQRCTRIPATADIQGMQQDATLLQRHQNRTEQIQNRSRDRKKQGRRRQLSPRRRRQSERRWSLRLPRGFHQQMTDIGGRRGDIGDARETFAPTLNPLLGRHPDSPRGSRRTDIRGDNDANQGRQSRHSRGDNRSI